MKTHNVAIVRTKGEKPFGALPEIISLLSKTMERIRTANARIPMSPYLKALNGRAGGMRRI